MFWAGLLAGAWMLPAATPSGETAKGPTWEGVPEDGTMTVAQTETTGALSGPAVTLVVTESFVAGHPETVCRASRPQCDVWIPVFHLKKASLVERHTVVEGPASEVGPRQLAIIGAPVDEEPVATRHPALAAHGMQTAVSPTRATNLGPLSRTAGLQEA